GATVADLEVALEDVDRGRPVVVYCAVGVRAATIGQRLGEIGFDRVEALEGSIFRWANEGRALEGEGGPASTVHPYNAAWGKLLDPSVRERL
ncbi:rhodanese-like domain-containing protein, partial [Rubrivirga sp.]|uniref:rhodanese-like domain-containing protein n=1 Tax=Rubrivirga sp. TaxID=1885344 RepID=UPI003C73A402